LPSAVRGVGPAGGHVGFTPGFEIVAGGGFPCCDPAGAVRAFGFGVWAQIEAESESAMRQAIGPVVLTLMECMRFTRTFCMQNRR
jgi:hypothetical protein